MFIRYRLHFIIFHIFSVVVIWKYEYKLGVFLFNLYLGNIKILIFVAIRNCNKKWKNQIVIKKFKIFYKNQWHVDTYVVRQFIEGPRDYIQSTTIRKPAKKIIWTSLISRFVVFIFYCIISYLIFLYFIFNNIIFVDLWCLFENQINTLLFYVDTKRL